MEIAVNDVVVWCSVGSLVVGTVAGVVAKVYPTVRKLQTLIDDWVGEPSRPGVPAKPGVMERLGRLEQVSESTNYHVQANHGGSAYDRLYGRVENLDETVGKRVDEIFNKVEETINRKAE